MVVFLIVLFLEDLMGATTLSITTFGIMTLRINVV
jgi:hypothetical protein